MNCEGRTYAFHTMNSRFDYFRESSFFFLSWAFKIWESRKVCGSGKFLCRGKKKKGEFYEGNCTFSFFLEENAIVIT